MALSSACSLQCKSSLRSAPHSKVSADRYDVAAAKLATELNRRYEEEFSRLERGLPKTLAQPTYELALEKLNTFGLYRNAMNYQSAPADIASDFLDYMEDKLRATIYHSSV